MTASPVQAAYRTHPEYLDLLAAVRANPDDDLVRLACADWLDDRGYAKRAEEIRDQVQKWPTSLRCSIWDRPDGTHGSYSGSRGFVTDFHGTFAEWLAHADAVLPESVGLTVRLTDTPEVEFIFDRGVTWATLAGVPAASRQLVPGLTPYVTGGVELNAPVLLRRQWADVARWELPPAPYTQNWFRFGEDRSGNGRHLTPPEHEQSILNVPPITEQHGGGGAGG